MVFFHFGCLLFFIFVAVDELIDVEPRACTLADRKNAVFRWMTYVTVIRDSRRKVFCTAVGILLCTVMDGVRQPLLNKKKHKKRVRICLGAVKLRRTKTTTSLVGYVRSNAHAFFSHFLVLYALHSGKAFLASLSPSDWLDSPPPSDWLALQERLTKECLYDDSQRSAYMFGRRQIEKGKKLY